MAMFDWTTAPKPQDGGWSRADSIRERTTKPPTPTAPTHKPKAAPGMPSNHDLGVSQHRNDEPQHFAIITRPPAFTSPTSREWDLSSARPREFPEPDPSETQASTNELELAPAARRLYMDWNWSDALNYRWSERRQEIDAVCPRQQSILIFFKRSYRMGLPFNRQPRQTAKPVHWWQTRLTSWLTPSPQVRNKLKQTLITTRMLRHLKPTLQPEFKAGNTRAKGANGARKRMKKIKARTWSERRASISPSRADEAPALEPTRQSERIRLQRELRIEKKTNTQVHPRGGGELSTPQGTRSKHQLGSKDVPQYRPHQPMKHQHSN